MFDKDEFKQSLTIEDIEKIFTYFKADYHINNNGELVAETICHNRYNGSHKLYYYPDSHTFYCYTHCGSFDIYDLVEKVNLTRGNKLTFRQCIKQISDILGRNINLNNKIKGVQTNVKLINDWSWLKKISKKTPVSPQLKTINESIINYFDEQYPYAWFKEGITVDTMNKYDIRFYSEMCETIIPHRDQEGNLVGIRSRVWNKEAVKKAKYRPTYIGDKGFNHPLGYTLFGLHQNKEAIKRKKKAMIVEGEKSCLFSDSYYGDDNFVVAICGSNVSRYQARLLIDLGIEELIIAIDKEYFINEGIDYEKYMKKVMRIAKHFAPYCRTYHLTDTCGRLGLKQSPLDISKEELEQMMKVDKHLITMKDLEGIL
ncbi:hypothetical protein [Staphylococcus agnetis]|uniref:DNA primase n=1 Tax=Staphylococcus agnetis TaxID=985762 RepID=A0ABX3Z0T4_9STAP|nr:hypothetical protein [Staphylococcus agnetis]MDG4943940.1 hypothetical protein [Staphylococcus agnetis]OSP22595.1 hypothetical protein B9L42_00515 [Staphylococcus agnetis]OSP23114.1 hypothetical protein B9M87_09280 [Staphylococcus agnetis]OTW30511.1 hypothetical protein B9M88_09590 [Staphylococcus agnetis]